ncbi:OX-2 membrane glycoprotein-like isoform X2 [Pungitius pungitius]|uniref:OX-2 membrane glycoprotein-like isoform X2 n=1 Tax=Pungitius pungitius TaxID=134920 RepID=UPI002E166B84
MLLMLLLTTLLFKGCRSQITGYGNKTADYGGDAHYSCSVADTTGVLQVTWQRVFKEKFVENLATYSERFGQQVNDPHAGKVIFTEASLRSTSITLRNVTWGDESCYVCSFNVYPDGSKRQQTCLTVQGISEVTTEVQDSRSGREEEGVRLVFSCSATGKPAPTIRWDLSPGASRADEPSNRTDANGDHTFTSSSNVTVRAPAGWTGHADCLLNSGAPGQRRERIAFSSPAREEDEEGKGVSSLGIALVITVVLLILLTLVVAAAVTRKRSMATTSRNHRFNACQV